MSSTLAIEAIGLSKEFSDVKAVNDLSFTVETGQVCGLLGPNGAGKTTTVRMVVGLIRANAGRARVLGEEVAPSSSVLRRVGLLVEKPAFVPYLSGMRNLQLHWAAGGDSWPPPGLDDAIELANLGPAIDRKVKGYSQGMRQRLGLAAALMREPSLLLLDEPANGMDPAGIAEFRTLLRSLAGRGITVFLSSHLLAEVEQICDQVAVLRSGLLVEQGPVAGLATARARVRVVLDPADKRAALALLAPWAARPDGPDTVLVDQADGQAVTRALGQGGVWPHQVVLDRPALEEAFLTMTEDTTAVNDATASR